MKELKGSTALVTGGSRGIGLAIARSLAEGGARVAVIGRDEGRSQAAAGSLPGEGHVGYGCDVSAEDAVRETVQAVESSLGPVEILVNNAGITRDNLLVRMRDEEWNEVMDVNLKGTYILTRIVSRGMMKRRSGCIINISSVVGLTGNAGQANYAASKAGLLGFTKSVARELAPRGVRCNAIAPGFIETDMTAGLSEEAVKELASRIPMGRLGTPEDVAGVARFLAGPWARYITGQVLTVDGGMVM